uniref:Uncharacterized protein n=1 Tax=Aegilops tauschii subsp. strangulata TaxID=200361 RepID=A0A453K9I8_AEGTS
AVVCLIAHSILLFIILEVCCCILQYTFAVQPISWLVKGERSFLKEWRESV